MQGNSGMVDAPMARQLHVSVFCSVNGSFSLLCVVKSLRAQLLRRERLL